MGNLTLSHDVRIKFRSFKWLQNCAECNPNGVERAIFAKKSQKLSGGCPQTPMASAVISLSYIILFSTPPRLDSFEAKNF